MPGKTFDQIATHTLNTGFTGLDVRKSSNVVVVTFDGVNPSSDAIYTLPSGWRPSYTARGVLKAPSQSNYARTLIDTNGEIKVVDATASGTMYYGQTVFIT